jgi:hypothetical protein
LGLRNVDNFILAKNGVNGGEKMHRRGGAKMHQVA